MMSDTHTIADIIGILIAMMMVLFYFRQNIESLFADKRHLLISVIVLIILFGLCFMYFKGLGF
jgi:uncharacterized membrane protein